MKFIVRNTDYVIRALVYMAKEYKKDKDRIVTVDEIVKEEGLPERFLRRLLQKLVKKGIIKSFKGKAGGFAFSVLPSKIKLTDIINIFQGKVDLTNCFLKGNICPEVKRCVLKKKLGKLTKTLNKELDKITIKSLS